VKNLIALAAVALPSVLCAQGARAPAQKVVVARSSSIIESRGLRFKDLNKNGVVDPYEDWRLTPAARARDLVRRMTLEEKAGTMMHGTARTGGALGVAGVGAHYDLDAVGKLVRNVGVTSFITRLGGDAASLAEENNKLQEISEATRLGIPLTISTDPRIHFQYVIGASVQSGRFSQWPETLGFAAIRDASLSGRHRKKRTQLDRCPAGDHRLAPPSQRAAARLFCCCIRVREE